MVTHYLTHVFPNGYKAQVVATHARQRYATRTHIDTALANAIVELEQANPRKLDLARSRS